MEETTTPTPSPNPLMVTPEMERAVRDHWDAPERWNGRSIFLGDIAAFHDVVKVVTTMRYFSQGTPYTLEEQDGTDWGPRKTAEWVMTQEMLDKDNTVLSRRSFIPCSCCGGEWNLENAFDTAKEHSLMYAEFGVRDEMRERKKRYSKWFRHYPFWRRVWSRAVVHPYWRLVHKIDRVRWFLEDVGRWLKNRPLES